MLVYIDFFFSSRRRHTRLQGDWSSDVCSSDLLQSLTSLLLFSAAVRTCFAAFSEALELPVRLMSISCASPGKPGKKAGEDRKSTRLNSSHLVISYAVFCLKKKKIQTDNTCVSG